MNTWQPARVFPAKHHISFLLSPSLKNVRSLRFIIYLPDFQNPSRIHEMPRVWNFKLNGVSNFIFPMIACIQVQLKTKQTFRLYRFNPRRWEFHSLLSFFSKFFLRHLKIFSFCLTIKRSQRLGCWYKKSERLVSPLHFTVVFTSRWAAKSNLWTFHEASCQEHERNLSRWNS